jgi:hypothetical protein
MLNLRGGEVWRAAKFANPPVGATIVASTGREGKQANTMAEKEKMLRGESIPRNDGDQYYEQPTVGQGQELITEQLVERALYSHSVKKARGPDKVSVGAIRPISRWNETRLVELTHAAVRT